MPLNNFLPFAPTDTGTNLLSQSDYAAASDRTNGNQPGVASSKLVNKALRQAAYISSQFAQFLSDQLGADIVDNATPAQLLAQIKATMQPLPVVATSYASVGSGTHSLTYFFFLASANATAGATYTNNSNTYTVTKTIASGALLQATGPGVPALSGVLTKASGTGDASITFYAFRAPVSLRARVSAGGGGGAGSGTSGFGAGGNGSTSSFGALISCAGGGGSPSNGAGTGGSATITAPAVGIAIRGGNGTAAVYSANTWAQGGPGGSNAFGGAGGAGSGATGGNDASPGSGGGGGGGGNNAPDRVPGGGGGAGGYADARIASPSGTYAWVVGGAGAGGGAGANGYSGGNGGYGQIFVEEIFQ